MTSNFEIKVRIPPKAPKKPEIKVHIPLHRLAKQKIEVRIRLQPPKKPEIEVPTPPQPRKEPEFRLILPLLTFFTINIWFFATWTFPPSQLVFNVFETSTFRDSMMPLSSSGNYMLEYASKNPSKQPGRS
jgi:hypothetical protein